MSKDVEERRMNVEAGAVVVVIGFVEGMICGFENGFNYPQVALVGGNCEILRVLV